MLLFEQSFILSEFYFEQSFILVLFEQVRFNFFMLDLCPVKYKNNHKLQFLSKQNQSIFEEYSLVFIF